mgnify:CR=1 FL=1|jgi:hypothetical protein
MGKQPIAIFSTDKHLKEDNALDLFDLAEQEIALAQELGVTTIVWLGDIFDSRLSQRQELLNCLTEMLNMYYEAGLNIICIPGNHDKTDYEADESFLTPYKYHPGFDLIETPQARVIGGVDFDFVPFYSVDMWLDKFAQLEPPPGTKSVLCSHTAVQGSINNDGKVVENRIKTKLFHNYGKVLLGHYHNAQQPASNVFHLPSVRQNNFGEDEEKGFTVLYSDTSFDFIKSDFVPYREINVDVAKVSKTDLQKLYKEVDENAHSRVVLIGDQQSVKGINKKWFTEHGIAVKAKYTDVEVTEVEEKEVAQELSGEDLKDKFAAFCAEKGYNYKEGFELLKEIMKWQE